MIRHNTMRSSDPPADRNQTANKPSAARRDEPRNPPVLRFSPTAWAKLLFLRDRGDSEVGGFGIATKDDLLFVEDIKLVRQVDTVASVEFDDVAVAEFFDEQVDLGRRPQKFARIWIHTHPGNSPEPSGTDEATFCRVFGRTDWAVMLILARYGRAYARLRFHVGPGGDVELPVTVDYSRSFPASDHAAWDKEYAACVQIQQWLPAVSRVSTLGERRGLLASIAERDGGFPADPASPYDPWDANVASGDDEDIFDRLEDEDWWSEKLALENNNDGR